MKAIESGQTEVSDKVKKQEEELHRLKTYLSDDGRFAKSFFYRLMPIDKFFEDQKDVNSPIFTVKGRR